MSRRPVATLAVMSFAVAFLASGCSHTKTGLDVQMVNYTYKPVHVSITGGESVTFHNGTQITHNFTLLKGGSVAFDVGGWRSQVASRKNDDGTVSFITIDPTIRGFEFVAGSRDGKRTLTLRDAQHEYVFVESL